MKAAGVKPVMPKLADNSEADVLPVYPKIGTPEWNEEHKRDAALELFACFDARYGSPDFDPEPDEPPAPDSIPAAIAYLIENYFVGGWKAAQEWMATQEPTPPENKLDGSLPEDVGDGVAADSNSHKPDDNLEEYTER